MFKTQNLKFRTLNLPVFTWDFKSGLENKDLRLTCGLQSNDFDAPLMMTLIMCNHLISAVTSFTIPSFV